MKKLIFGGLIVGMLALLGVGVVALGAQENTTEEINQSWTFSSPKIEEIYIAGLNQPVNLVVEQTDKADTEVRVTGKVPERSLKALTDKEISRQDEDTLNLAFEKPNSVVGTGHIEINPEAREAVTITVSLGMDAVLKHLELDSTGGQINLSVPDDFEAVYDLQAIDAEVINAPQSQAGTDTTVKVTNYFHDLIVD